uniref:Uncharacterized protein n=1 Tax=Zea mays TaxID=4577 RepID=C4J035_MAIZE|nr:unknown [Zea mays]
MAAGAGRVACCWIGPRKPASRSRRCY